MKDGNNRKRSTNMGIGPINGVCENTGWYVPKKDAEKGDFVSNKKFFSEGDVFPGKEPWIQIPN